MNFHDRNFLTRSKHVILLECLMRGVVDETTFKMSHHMR